MSTISFFDYEKSNNQLFKALSANFKDIITFIKQNDASIIAPQSVSLESLKITREFIESHVIVTIRLQLRNPGRPSEWITMNGIFGMFGPTRETLHVIGSYNTINNVAGNFSFDPLVPIATLFQSVRSVFDEFSKKIPKRIDTSDIKNSNQLNSIVVLREGTVSFIEEKTNHNIIIPVILIAESVLSLNLLLFPSKSPTSTEKKISDSHDLISWDVQSSNITTNNNNNNKNIKQSFSDSNLLNLDYYPNSSSSSINSSNTSNSFNTSNIIPSSSPNANNNSVAVIPSSSSSSSNNLAMRSSVSSSNMPSIRESLSDVSSSKSASILKPKGLIEFLSTFGTSSNSQTGPGTTSNTSTPPLFPDSPDISFVGSTSKTGSAVSTNTNKMSVFFEKLKHPSAADLVKSIKTFVTKFIATRPDTFEQQGTIVKNFLSTMEEQIIEHTLWSSSLNNSPASSSEEELDGITEGLEKYVMTKLFDSTFGWHSDHRENEILEKRITQLQFITFDHLDIKPQFRNEASILLACNELRKINSYKTPRDKLVCIWNSCKVIYTILHKASGESGNSLGADDFLPLAIYVVLRANPKHLYTNIQNSQKMMTEMGYYFTQIESAVAFIKTVDASKLSFIDHYEFNKKLEEEVAKLEIKGHRFFGYAAEDLTIRDIPILLKDYKELVMENERLKKQIKQLKL